MLEYDLITVIALASSIQAARAFLTLDAAMVSRSRAHCCAPAIWSSDSIVRTRCSRGFEITVLKRLRFAASCSLVHPPMAFLMLRSRGASCSQARRSN